MSLELKGRVKQLFPQETKGTFTFKNIWITTDGDTQYPQTIEIQVSGQKLNLLDNLKVGQDATFHVNLRGREYNGKIYHSFSAWKVEASTIVAADVVAMPGEQNSDTLGSDLPF